MTLCDRCHIDAADCRCPGGSVLYMPADEFDRFMKWLDEPDDPAEIARLRKRYRTLRENSQIDLAPQETP